MKTLEKLKEALSESNDSRVISEILYEITTPKEHKEILSFLIKRLNGEPNILHKYFNQKSDTSQLEATEQEIMENDFSGFVIFDQFDLHTGGLAGN